jgi:tetratricopeptide (TPR) repeat protein
MNDPCKPQTHSAEAEFRLAHAWQRQGKLQRALAGYQRVVHLQPDYAQAHVELVALLLELGYIPEAVETACHALDLFPNEAKLHKSFVQASVAHTGDLTEAFDYYQLTRIDHKTVAIEPRDVLCCCVVRNEAVRLPYFLTYYRQKGVGKFLFVDNDSSDGTLPYLLQQPDVYVWQSPYSFNRANFGSAWFELVLRQHGVGHWCLIVDADELFYYPDCERKSLIQLCHGLDDAKRYALNALHVDMYSDKAIKDTHYMPGQRFEEVCPYFDRQFYHTTVDNYGPFRNQTAYLGGVRQRIFGTPDVYYLSKVPLLKYKTEVALTGGQHWTNYSPEEMAAGRGCLLHFKFFSSFSEHVKQEAQRQEHCFNARLYKEYAQGIAQNENLKLYDERHSVKLQDSQQLVQLGIMQR